MSYGFVVAERHVPFGTVAEALSLVRWLESFGVTHLGLTFHFGGVDHPATRTRSTCGGAGATHRALAADGSTPNSRAASSAGPPSATRS